MTSAPTPSAFLRFRFPLVVLVMTGLAFMGQIRAAHAAGEDRVTGRVTINGEAAARAVVFLHRADGEPEPMAPREHTIRQKDLRFDPDFVVVPVGTTIAFENLDKEIHNIHSRSKANRFDTGAHMPDTTTRVTLKHPGAVPLRCRTHERMRGLIYVTPSPYFAVTNGQGTFEMPGVPEGAYRAEVWHPRLSPEEQARGGATVTVAADTAVSAVFPLHAEAAPGADLTDSTDQDWRAVTDELREQLLKAVALWKSGAITAATIRVTTAQSRIYGESGLRDAIAKGLRRERAEEHERRMDQLRKRVQGLVDASDTEASLTRAVDEIVGELNRDVAALLHPAPTKG